MGPPAPRLGGLARGPDASHWDLSSGLLLEGQDWLLLLTPRPDSQHNLRAATQKPATPAEAAEPHPQMAS